MRLDVSDDLNVLAAFLADRPIDATTMGYRDGALWALARLSGRDRDDLAADLAALIAEPRSVSVMTRFPADAMPATLRPTPVADAIPAAQVFDRDEMIRMAAAPPPDAFGPAFLGLRVTREPAPRTPRAPTPSFTAAGAEAVASGDAAAQPIPPDALEAIHRERAAALADEMAQPTRIPEDDGPA